VSADTVRFAPAGLEDFNAAGVLNAADVHVARALGRIGGEESPLVLLAAALSVRGLRLGHTCIDLRSVADTVTPAEGAALALEELEWPAPEDWREAVAASGIVGENLPLRLDAWRVYLDRYWRAEQVLVEVLRSRAGELITEVDEGVLREGLASMDDPHQRRAAETAVRRRLAVVAGGPGTGKTTTLRKIVDLLVAQATALGHAPPRVALVAPTGKAAQRVTESLADDDYRALTIHKLLRRRPDNSTRFRHDRRNPLPHDVVVVDETSMVSLDLMAKLLDAIRPEARVVLVGDPDQLVSVEAGAVLGDIVDPARDPAAGDGPLADSIVVLQRARRYAEDSAIAALAAAVRDGDDDAAVSVLRGGDAQVRWIVSDVADDTLETPVLAPVRQAVLAAGRAVFDAAEQGLVGDALAALNRVRLLCAHRHGPYGVSTWVPRVERWLAAGVDGFAPADPWYIGRPVLVTANDYQLGVFNGDVGVTIRHEDRRVVAFAQSAGEPKLLSTHRLEAIETVHAMTIHKSQGSQLAHPVVILPDPSSRILTRELFYTAVTRAETALTIVGTEDAVRAAVRRRVQRVSGLGERLWG
jgi:exodeoxyribonuclease V alpha subunit